MSDDDKTPNPEIAKLDDELRKRLEQSRKAFANPRTEDERKMLALVEKQLADLGN